MNASHITAIASHLNVSPNQIKRCEEWATVMFVVVTGKGARFVSKKVVKVSTVKISKGTEKFLAEFDRLVASGQTERAVRKAKALLEKAPAEIKSCPRADIRELIRNGATALEEKLAQIN